MPPCRVVNYVTNARNCSSNLGLERAGCLWILEELLALFVGATRKIHHYFSVNHTIALSAFKFEVGLIVLIVSVTSGDPFHLQMGQFDSFFHTKIVLGLTWCLNTCPRKAYEAVAFPGAIIRIIYMLNHHKGMWEGVDAHLL